MTNKEINVIGSILQNALKNIELKSKNLEIGILGKSMDGTTSMQDLSTTTYLNPMTGNYITSKHFALQGELKVILNELIDEAVSNFLKNKKTNIEIENHKDLLEYAKIGLESVVDVSPYIYSDDLESIGFGLLSKEKQVKVLGKLMLGPHKQNKIEDNTNE